MYFGEIKTGAEASCTRTVALAEGETGAVKRYEVPCEERVRSYGYDGLSADIGYRSL